MEPIISSTPHQSQMQSEQQTVDVHMRLSEAAQKHPLEDEAVRNKILLRFFFFIDS
jgi:hypothetical protein